MKFMVSAILAAVLTALGGSAAQAHFPWLVITGQQSDDRQLQCFFAETPAADDPELLKYLQNAQVFHVAVGGKPDSISLQPEGAALSADLDPKQWSDLYVLKKDLGVMSRGGSSFFLRYYAKTGPEAGSFIWSRANTSELLDLDAVPSQDGDQLELKVLFQGKPAAGAEVTWYNALGPAGTATTDDKGVVSQKLTADALEAVRVKHTEQTSGEQDGKTYSEARHYLTLTFPALSYKPIATAVPFPAIPEAVTSLGAASTGDAIYLYGGNIGGAHHYSNTGQAKTLWRLKTAEGSVWEPLGEGPALQGLAMVADGGRIYRIGGFTAKNEEGDDADLWSQANVSGYDPATGQWTELPPLPEARSSFDAAVLDHTIYVIGGWALQGGEESEWHQTAWSLDLNASPLQWKELPKPPFQRRALSVAAYKGKLYAIGGMQPEGGPTTRVAIYDPESASWSEGPALVGGAMTGFGSSSFERGGRLYVTAFDGTLQRLAKDGQSWEVVGNLENARFFHRMLPLDDKTLVLVGGANMGQGKFSEVEVLDVTTLDGK